VWRTLRCGSDFPRISARETLRIASRPTASRRIRPHRQRELLGGEIPVPGALLGDGGQIRGVGEEVLEHRQNGGPELVLLGLWTVLLG